MMHYWLFPRRERRWLNWLQKPFQLLTQLVFFLLLPPILFYLDRLDTVKDHTLGWVCIAEKSSTDEHAAAPAQ
jgi:hypothetical protein